MKINVKSKGTQPTCQMPFVVSCEHCFFYQPWYSPLCLSLQSMQLSIDNLQRKLL